MSKPPVVWTIAGFDPSSGAGITADLKTMASLDCYGVACITALTVQNTLGVRRIEPISPQIIRDTLQALIDDFTPNAIKIGMLATAEIVGVIADFLTRLRLGCPVVLDPIFRSSSGTELLDAEGICVLRDRLLPLTTVATPNRAEAALLTGLTGNDADAMAQRIRQLGAAAAVVTGGDAWAAKDAAKDAAKNSARDAEYSEDVLAYAIAGIEFVETLSAPRVHSTSTHGTGCAFSTAIACALARGRNIPMAVTLAKSFVRRAIEGAPGLGNGKGPMDLDRAGEEKRNQL